MKDPCLKCGNETPPMFGGAYGSPRVDVGPARIYLCPVCLGAFPSEQEAMAWIRQNLPGEARP